MANQQELPKGKWFAFRSRLIALGVIGRAGLARAPRALSTSERLAMLPLEGAPVAAAVSVRWNDYQVPAIKADSDHDLFVVLGIVHAHLRLAQMELLRRIALGRLAEVMGPIAAEFDHSLRLNDFPRCAEEAIAQTDEETRSLSQAFIAGINHHLATASELPYELRALRVTPEPWTERDFFAVQRLLSIDMSWNIWSQLMPLRERLSTTEWRALWRRLLACGAPGSFDQDNRITRLMAATARHGSNAWAQAKADGKGAVLASDPHLPFGIPGPFLMAIMDSPGFKCLGLMMPGQPFVAIGRNRRIAWGGTSLHAQSSDLFDVSTAPDAQFQDRPVIIRSRGYKDIKLTLKDHRLGPVVSTGSQFKSSTPMALKWMGHAPSNENKAMLDVARAHDWTAFRAAIRHFAVSGLNLVYADVEGHSGRLCAAHMPVRPLLPPADIPLSMEDAGAWERSVDSESLPMEFDREDGTVVSANAEPSGQQVPVGFFFSPPYRQSRIQQCLDENRQPSVTAMAALQQDVGSSWSLRLCRWLLERLPANTSESEYTAAIEALSAWDGGYQPDSYAALLFTLWLGNLIEGNENVDTLSAFEQVWGREQHAEELMRSLFDSPDDSAAAEAQLLTALATACEQAEKWGSWGKFHAIDLNHPLSSIPGMGKHIGKRKVLGAGSNDTVYKTSNTFSAASPGTGYGSCARFIADTSGLDDNHALLLGGQDGWIGSANFDDQLPLWEKGEYLHLPLDWDSVESEFSHLTTFIPAG